MVVTSDPTRDGSLSKANSLIGMRVLVIEDVWMLAQSYASLLGVLGVVIVGPVGTVAVATAIIDAEPIDAALVDMNLHGEMAYGVVEALNARAVPVVVATGYDVVPELEHTVTAFLKKPIRAEALIKALRGIAAAA